MWLFGSWILLILQKNNYEFLLMQDVSGKVFSFTELVLHICLVMLFSVVGRVEMLVLVALATQGTSYGISIVATVI